MPDGQVAQNRRARFDYEILQRYEAGLVLTGSEIKSVRAHHVQLQGSYARFRDGELWLHDVHIAPYANAGYEQHEAKRDRKLLLHRKELARIREALQQQGLTVVPLSMYLKRGRAKVELGIARGRRSYDKRHAIREREVQREIARTVRRG